MIKEFVPYDRALKLKELGFDEKCFCNWEESWSPEPEDEIRMVLTTDQTWLRDGWIRAPTFSQAFRWFREKYGYDVTIKKCTPSEYKFEIEQLFVEGNNYYFIDFSFDTYEEAELACLDKLIELVEGILLLK
jgi:hypothetical protein